MSHEIDQLEMQLRVLGRQLGSASPRVDLLQQVRQSSRMPLASSAAARAMQSRRQRLVGLYMLLLVTFPIPLLFLWMDWSAINSMFNSLLPASISGYVAGFFLWLKFAALILIYGIGIAGIIWTVMSARQVEGRFAMHDEVLEA